MRIHTFFLCIWAVVASLTLISTLQAAGENIPEAYKQAYSNAVQAFQKEEFDRALTALQSADTAFPRQSQTYNLMGAVYVKQKKYDDAEHFFMKAYQADTSNSIALFNLGEVYFLKKDYVKSRETFVKFMSQKGNKNNALARLKVVLCDVVMGKSAEVEKLLKSDIQPHPENPLWYYANAAVKFQANDEEKARGFIQSAFTIYPGGMNAAFADSFIELKWLNRTEVEQIGAIDASALKALSNLDKKDGKKPAKKPVAKPAEESGMQPATGLDSLVPDVQGR